MAEEPEDPTKENENPAESPEEKPAADKKAERAEREEVARLKQELKELKESERYWAAQAQRGGKGEEEETPEEEPEDLSALGELLEKYKEEKPEAAEMSAEDFVDELSKIGPKAVQKLVEKMGYVRKQDVAKMAAEISRDIARAEVRAEVTKRTHDAELVQRFPALKDESSELFKETGKVFRAAVAKDPRLKASPVALMMAAEAAEEKLKARNGARRPKDEDYDYREADERERTRRERVKSQQGDTGRGTAREEEDDGLGPQAKQLVAMWGLEEADYKKAKRRG
jgi:hypothetical protein